MIEQLDENTLRIELKKTRKKPNVFIGAKIGEDKLISFSEYLYSDTGDVARFFIAMKQAVKEGDIPKEKIEIFIKSKL